MLVRAAGGEGGVVCRELAAQQSRSWRALQGTPLLEAKAHKKGT